MDFEDEYLKTSRGPTKKIKRLVTSPITVPSTVWITTSPSRIPSLLKHPWKTTLRSLVSDPVLRELFLYPFLLRYQNENCFIP